MTVFYKAAFYDRNAHMGLSGRYKIEYPSDAVDRDTMPSAVAKVIDIKTGNVLHEATGLRSVLVNGGIIDAPDAAWEEAGKWCDANLPKDLAAAWLDE